MLHSFTSLRYVQGNSRLQKIKARVDAAKLAGKGKGDLKVRVKIAVPTKLTTEQKELLRRFDSSRDEDVRAHIA